MLCSKKATDVSHEANGEAFCPDVCELLQLAMLKDFLFRAIKLLSAQIVQRGCSGSVLSALFCSCLSVSSALLCSCCSVLSTLLCVCRSLLSVLSCLCSSAARAAAAATAAAASAAACSAAARLAAHKAVKRLGRTALRLDSLAARAARHLDAGDSCC